MTSRKDTKLHNLKGQTWADHIEVGIFMQICTISPSSFTSSALSRSNKFTKEVVWKENAEKIMVFSTYYSIHITHMLQTLCTKNDHRPRILHGGFLASSSAVVLLLLLLQVSVKKTQ